MDAASIVAMVLIPFAIVQDVSDYKRVGFIVAGGITGQQAYDVCP